MITARPKGMSAAGKVREDLYSTESTVYPPNDKVLKRKKLECYCLSKICLAEHHEQNLSTVDGMTYGGVKKDQPYTDTFCRDCGSALFWQRE